MQTATFKYSEQKKKTVVGWSNVYPRSKYFKYFIKGLYVLYTLAPIRHSRLLEKCLQLYGSQRLEICRSFQGSKGVYKSKETFCNILLFIKAVDKDTLDSFELE